MAELELTMVPSPRFHPGTGMYVLAGEGPEAAPRGESCLRSFWCSLKEHEVEVEFETKSVLRFPRLVGVRRCSLFDEAENVACGRDCLDSTFRRQWAAALPIVKHLPPLGG